MLERIKSEKNKSIIIAVLSLILVAAIVFTSYASVFGEVYAYGTTYISEVKVFSGDSLNDAIKKCEEAGYTAVKKNINYSEKGDIKDNGIYDIYNNLIIENSDEIDVNNYELDLKFIPQYILDDDLQIHVKKAFLKILFAKLL